jgi:hypothetical protein
MTKITAMVKAMTKRTIAFATTMVKNKNKKCNNNGQNNCNNKKKMYLMFRI